MPETYHQEFVESPNRRDFHKETYRRWHVMTTLVEHDGRKIAGRFIVPLRLVRPLEGPGRDMEADSYLVGRSWEGGLLQMPAWKWIKGNGPMAVVTSSDPSPDAGAKVRSRNYPCLFLLVREWRDVSAKNVAHPVIGHMMVKVKPRLVEDCGKLAFESECGIGINPTV